MPDVQVALEELKEESESGALSAVMAPSPTGAGAFGFRRHRRHVRGGRGGGVAGPSERNRYPETDFKAVPLTRTRARRSEPSLSPDGNARRLRGDGAKADNYGPVRSCTVVSRRERPQLTADSLPDRVRPAWAPTIARSHSSACEEGGPSPSSWFPARRRRQRLADTLRRTWLPGDARALLRGPVTASGWSSQRGKAATDRGPCTRSPAETGASPVTAFTTRLAGEDGRT